MITNDLYNELLRQVQAGKISPKEAVRIMKGGMQESAPNQAIAEASKISVKAGVAARRCMNRRPKNELKRRQVAKTEVPKGSEAEAKKEAVSYSEDDIAVIGFSGRFPDASNIEEFWKNLKAGKDSVRVLPEERFHTSKFYSEDGKAANKSYCVSGGYLENVAYFDASFFNISPLEAQYMDPQSRLFLEETWKAFEHAGYGFDQMSGTKCGVFVGCVQGDYVNQIREQGMKLNAHVLNGYSTNMLAARISYYLNLSGKNLCIDTACSSSLVAIHEACQSILHGECNMALAGGVYVASSMDMYIMTSKGAMLSKTGRCSVFDGSADGFVPSEAVGCIVLKRLIDAIKDHDSIYGVIKGSAINYDGRTNGITAPSMLSQAALEQEVYEKTGINPETITYIETHGTGTKLGDPIEVNALKKSFGTFTKKKGFCALGSVKSNIGHALCASGIVSVIKVLLCLTHKELVPTIHFNKLNEHITLTDTPFYINTEHQPWKTDGTPRRACVSSFGLSGTNCHMIIEEAPENQTEMKKSEPRLIVLSAKSVKALHQKKRELYGWLLSNGEKVSFDDISYTLLYGRTHFSYREAWVVSSVKELEEKLKENLAKTENNQKACSKDKEEIEKETQLWNQCIHKLSETSQETFLSLQEAAKHYVNGAKIADEIEGIAGKESRRIALPVYPFEEEYYWIEGEKEAVDTKDDLIERVKENQFRIRFHGKESFFLEHVVNGIGIMPGAEYLDLIKRCMAIYEPEEFFRYENVVFYQPFSKLQDSLDLYVEIQKVSDAYQFTFRSNPNEMLYAQGTCKKQINRENTVIPVNEIRNRMVEEQDTQTLYHTHLEKGVEYKNSFQTVKQCSTGKREALAYLEVPEEKSSYYLHPALLDGALQTIAALPEYSSYSQNGYLPFSIGEVSIYGTLQHCAYSYITLTEMNENALKADIEICNEDGTRIVSLKDVVSIPFKKEKNNIVYIHSVWKERMLEPNKSELLQGVSVIFAQEEAMIQEVIEEGQIFSDKAHVLFVKFGTQFQENGNQITIRKGCEADYSRLFEKAGSYGEALHILYYQQEALLPVSKLTKENLYDATIGSLTCIVKGIYEASIHQHVTILSLCQGNHALHHALSGFARSVMLERNKIAMKVIDYPENMTKRQLAQMIQCELAFDAQSQVMIQYKDGKRYEMLLEESVVNGSKPDVIFTEGGVYLISGGMGGLGRIFARYITEVCHGTAILLGRHEPDQNLKELLRELSPEGCIEYISCDVTDYDKVCSVVEQIKKKYSHINGVIHSAGVLKDALCIYKKKEAVSLVLEPKMLGVIHLDEALKEERLDFFVCFSAIASIFGNIGQADYAYANTFLDVFCRQREEAARKHQRYGKSISINWPYWEHGGMSINEQVKEKLQERLGMTPLKTRNGVIAFQQILAMEDTAVAVMEGNPEEICNSKAMRNGEFMENNCFENKYEMRMEPMTSMELADYVQKVVQKIIADAIMLPQEKLKLEESFDEYGIDSLVVLEVNDRLEEKFGKLSKTLLFEYKTVKELAAYLAESKKEEIKAMISTVSPVKLKSKEASIVKESQSKEVTIETDKPEDNAVKAMPFDENEIAIVGLAGRYPKAQDLEEFWDNLFQGMNCVTEIPKERWDYKKYFDANKDTKGKSYSKWGGFLQDVDKFDAACFHIAPREAEKMDPQERIFLETAYSAIEDAGYKKEDVKGKKIGVFVGVMYNNYQLLALDQYQKDGETAVNTSFSAIANRVSYFFDFHGESMAIDTMCSSSITALYSAFQSMKCGDIEGAIVGGVNLSLHYMKYLALSNGNFMSSDGRCKAFGANGDGYVPGEGVGAIYLKTLKKALEDGDHVYGLVKSVALNHGGHTNGFTVPNPNAQAEVIKEAWRKAKIDPRTITCIEAHGTGTSLGDPIEITGLSKAFMEYTDELGFCSIGSVKSNIGHLESAAGMAGITKVLLEMKHQILVPSIHSTELNPFLSLEESPFYVQQQPEEWKHYIEQRNGKEVVHPLRAGISAFGAGGSNAHVVIEQYQQVFSSKTDAIPQEVFVLSALNKSSLKEYAKVTIQHLRSQVAQMNDEQKNSYFHNVCYTAQVGREAFPERLAIIAMNLSDIIDGLSLYIEEQSATTVMTGNIYSQAIVNQNKVIDVKHAECSEIALGWVKGQEIDWTELDRRCKNRVSLPHYPFQKKRYWLNSFEGDKFSQGPLEVRSNHEPRVQKEAAECAVEESEVRQERIDWRSLANQYHGNQVSFEVIDGTIAVVRMQDYEHRNSFSNEMIAALIHTFEQIKANGNIKVVVITGCKNVFSMGGTKEQLNNIADQKYRFSDAPFLFRGLLEMDIPVISAIQGHASGGGMLFGLYADVVLLAEEGVYSATFTKYGFTPGMGATYILPERFGKLLANEMMLTAKTMTGLQLKERGASVIVKPQEEVLEEAIKLARLMSEKPRTTLSVLKKEMASRILQQLLPMIDVEEQMHRETFTQSEVKDRIRHFYIETNAKERVTEVGEVKEIQERKVTQKVQLVEKEESKKEVAVAHAEPCVDKEVTAKLTAIVGKILHMEADEIPDYITFHDMGVDSISGVEIIRDINQTFGISLDAVMLYDYPTVVKMSELIIDTISSDSEVIYAPKEEVWGMRKSEESGTVQQEQKKAVHDINTVEQVEQTLRMIVQKILHMDADEISDHLTFHEMGIDSISGVEIIRDINNKFDLNLDAVTLYDYPTVPEMGKYIVSLDGNKKVTNNIAIEQPTDLSSSFFFKSSAVYGRNQGNPEHKEKERTPEPLKEIEYSEKKTPAKKLKICGARERLEAVKRNRSNNKIILSSKVEGERKKDSKEDAKLNQDIPEHPAAKQGVIGKHAPMDIAIIGLSGRFPGADNVDTFWENLRNGVNSIQKVPPKRWNADEYYSPIVAEPDKSYCRNGGFLSNVEEFDPMFFHISPIEAESMDPQQRIFLEECWKAFEDAGYSDKELANKKCGVFVGAAQGDFTQKPGNTRSKNTAEAFTGVSSSILAARISYLLNLKGPSISVDTACSSSLVALHLACLSILNGDCEMALAGGVRLMFTPTLFLQTSKMEMLSKTGNCYAFDHRADGTIMSEGCGVVVLKPLQKAIEDGDYIYGVIKGSGTNQDGKTNGITAPSAQSQTQLELDVYERYGINPREISLMEAHGTGTSLGDPIEVKALTDAMRKYTTDLQFCSIGSVKTNIGHATMAAGVISLIKVLLAMKHKEIPPLLNYEKENDKIHFEESPFFVDTKLRPWTVENGKKRVAAISAFGFSGTNCHVVVEEAPK